MKPRAISILALVLLLLASPLAPLRNCIEINHSTREQTSPLRHEKQSQQRKSAPTGIVVNPELIIADAIFPQDYEPLFLLQCPISEIITRKRAVNSLSEGSIKKKLENIHKKIKIRWYKEDRPFTERLNGNRLDKRDEMTLIMYMFGETDTGHYRCNVDYSEVPPEMGEFFVFREGAEFDVGMQESLPDQAPIVTHPPGHIIAANGDTVTFTCNRTETLASSSTQWFKSCAFKDKTCVTKFMEAYNKSFELRHAQLLRPFFTGSYNDDVLRVENVTENKTGYYGCAVENARGMDIRLGQLDLLDHYLKNQIELRAEYSKQLAIVNSSPWVLVGMCSLIAIAILLVGCVYIFRQSIQRGKKQSAPLLNNVNGKDTQGKDQDSRRRLPNIEAPDIYNTGKSVDGFITGHFHQATGHLMAQSFCSNLLDKATPSISSANSHHSDEASSSWGKTSGDNCKAFYTPASNTTATTVPLYDHPPSTGTLGHCSTFIHGACINNPTYGFLRPENDATEWAFPRRNLDRLDKIGEGQFGEVWRYVARRRDGKENIVAVKQLKTRIGLGDRERLELIAEIEIMKSVNDHPNVIKLLHYCVDECGPTLLIMEYAENGKLQTYLRKCREPRKVPVWSGEAKARPNITSKELLKFTYHIAKGMEYVASQGIVHRDLASRNILVSEDRVCKVADFGFARRVNEECAYERTTTNPVPVKWMAPEALVGNKFTSKSDVFSLGILMWEIVTLGATPYEQLTSEGVYKKVTTGGRLERPPHCKDEFYNLMAQCWLHDPVQRPTFREVACQLEKLLLSENDYIELDQYPEHAYYNIVNTAEKEVVNLKT